jgi:L-cysteine:1D-myo-inositol 2-amino-2-deoxy-alpha-D-glucopyranoside ligase
VISLHDTAARSLRGLEVSGRPLRLYVCGITPYDGGHLGHAFTYHTFDVLVRRWRSLGREVRSVRNVTDVDDDMMRVSRERGVGWSDLAETVTAEFDRDMAAIGILAVDAEPRASRHVPAMIDWISELVRRGHAYAVDGWVYFEIATTPDYGALSRLGPAEMVRLSRERGADPSDPRKRAPLDFVLWQPSKPDEPAWDSPWGRGRPGWHIECSVLAARHLGTPIDVHGGGEDLIFPHHESEIVQAEAAGAGHYTRIWAHVAMVGYEGEKMSKSIGNLVFVRDLLRQASPAALRLLLSAHHHRQGWEYTEAGLAQAAERSRRYAAAGRAGRSLEATEAERWRRSFLDRIDDDLDTPGAVAVTDGLAERLLGPGDGDGIAGAALLAELLDLVGAGAAVGEPAR